MQQLATNKLTKFNRVKRLFRKNIGGWAIMLPSVILFAFFVWGPLLNNIVYSFSAMKGFTSTGWVWFDNYKTVFQDPAFLKALVNTFKYAFWSLLIGFLVPMVLGLILSEIIHLKGFFRAGIYLPSIISGIAVVMMWLNILNGSSGSMLNGILALFGQEPIQVLLDQGAVIPVIVVVMTWRGAGGTVLIYLSSLQTVDSALYEAARLDGANLLQRVRYVTIPSIKPTVKMLLMLQLISVFQVFYEPLVLTSGGPDFASISLMQLCYNYTFGAEPDIGKGAAVSVVLTLIILALTLIYFKLSKVSADEETN